MENTGEIDDFIEEIEEIEEEKPKQVETVVKKKRVLSQAQLDALARGRQKGVEKLKAKGAMTKQVKESKETIQKLKNEEKLDSIDDIKKINDLNYIRKTTEEMVNRFSMLDTNIKTVENRFNSYLTEREQRKQAKDNNTIERTIKQQLPKTMNDMMYREKIERERKNNIFYGQI